jgi:hypothetical protein
MLIPRLRLNCRPWLRMKCYEECCIPRRADVEEHSGRGYKVFSNLLLIGASGVAPAHRSCVPEWGSPPQINLMDEGESEHGLIYLSSHEIRSLQYVVKADGGAVSLPGHEVLRQQESPSLDRSERFHGNANPICS